MHLQFGIGNVVNDRLDQAGGLGGLLGSFGGGDKTSGQGEYRGFFSVIIKVWIIANL